MFYQETLVFPSGGQFNYRIPSIVVTNDGTAVAFCNNRIGTLKDAAEEVALVCAIKRPGEAWSNVQVLAHIPGWNCPIGSAVYDDTINKIIVFFDRNPVAKEEFKDYTPEQISQMAQQAAVAIEAAADANIAAGHRRLVSYDNGQHFYEESHEVASVLQTHWDGTQHLVSGSTHGSEHGIRLRHGPYAGRLLCPSRTKIGEYSDWIEIRKCVYNNSIYSDDHGKTWKASQCVQVGTAEGALIERSDGSVLFNSRAYFKDGLRRLAVSTDGGETYGDFKLDPFLREETRIGCNASFLRVEQEDLHHDLRLPAGTKDITVFCNPRSETRNRMAACISFDSGETFREARVIFDGPAAYSSLNYDKHSGHFYLLFEKGNPQKGTNPYTEGICVAEFDLQWLLQDLQ